MTIHRTASTRMTDDTQFSFSLYLCLFLSLSVHLSIHLILSFTPEQIAQNTIFVYCICALLVCSVCVRLCVTCGILFSLMCFSFHQYKTFFFSVTSSSSSSSLYIHSFVLYSLVVCLFSLSCMLPSIRHCCIVVVGVFNVFFFGSFRNII